MNIQFLDDTHINEWDNFVSGFAGRMKEEFKNDNLILYVPGFSSVTGIDQNMMMNYIQNKDFNGLLNFMVK